MKYSGIDLHSNNSVVTVTDDVDRVVAEKRLPNDLPKILAFLALWKAELAGVVVVSTFKHRMRQQLVKFRTMQINSLRGLLTEYGEVMRVGRAALDRTIAGVLEKLSERLPVIFIDTLREQWNGLDALDQQIVQIERRLQAWMKQDEAARAIAAIPGVGLLTATAAVATMGHAKSFRSGREFAAWLGLVPGQTGSGGKVELLGISKRGDTYLRTLLIHGARSVLTHAKDPGEWVEQMKKRRPLNVVVVARANKIARTIWALLAHQRPYEKGYRSVRPV
jgi:transposase